MLDKTKLKIEKFDYYTQFSINAGKYVLTFWGGKIVGSEPQDRYLPFDKYRKFQAAVYKTDGGRCINNLIIKLIDCESRDSVFYGVSHEQLEYIYNTLMDFQKEPTEGQSKENGFICKHCGKFYYHSRCEKQVCCWGCISLKDA